jgi:hypothetical protein
VVYRFLLRLNLCKKLRVNWTVRNSVPDPNPDPPDPHVFGPPGSGSFYHHAKIVRIGNIDSYYFVTLFDFLSLKNDVNVPSKSNSRKICVKINFLVAS